VDTRPERLGVEINPAVWKAIVVDVIEVPSPWTVEVKLVFRKLVDTRPERLGDERNPAV
jgi:hypothetical protein